MNFSKQVQRSLQGADTLECRFITKESEYVAALVYSPLYTVNAERKKKKNKENKNFA